MKTGILLLILAPLSSMAQSGEPTVADSCFRYGKLLDTDVAPAEREVHLARLHVAAGDGNGSAQHLLGTLYRLGPDHPAKLLPRDDSKAHHWLGKAVLDGQFLAMAGLAEMDIAAGKPMDAMVWAQVHSFFLRKYPPGGSSQAQEYAADLILRSFEALAPPEAGDRLVEDSSQDAGRPHSKALEEDLLRNVNAYLESHGSVIESALRERALANGQPSDEEPGCPPLYDTDRWPLELKTTGINLVNSRQARKMRRAGYGYFYLDVKPNGRVGRVLTVDALPGPEQAEALRKTVERLQFNAIKGAPVRGALVPMSYQPGDVKFRD